MNAINALSSTKAPDDDQANSLVRLLTKAPANLRFGNKATNNFVGDKVDPVGKNNQFPTDKECQMLHSACNLHYTYKKTNNPSSTTPLSSGSYFDSTGKDTFTVPKIGGKTF